MAAETLIFDLDGTVWDSWPWYAEIVERDGRVCGAAASLRRGRPPIATMLRQAGIDGDEPFRRVLESSTCPLFAGVPEALQALKDRGVAIGAVTNLPQWIAIPMIDQLGLEVFFDSQITFGSTPRHKPHPEPLRKCLEELESEPGSAAWYIGDTGGDGVAAASAGLLFGWAAYGYGPEQPECDAVLHRFADVLEC